MKKYHLLIVLLLWLMPVNAQEAKSKFSFYGSVRNDFYYQNRQAQESSEGFMMLFPKDYQYDATGRDLNRNSTANLLNMHTLILMIYVH